MEKKPPFRDGKKPPFEIYVHIPFCVKKCRYCDFLSFPAGEDLQAQYMEALRTEIRAFAEQMHESSKEPGPASDRIPQSIFIGGGTPSVPAPARISGIMEEIRAGFSTGDCEITIEANPGTLTPQGLREYRHAGINRISLGCQSAIDTELQTLGRIHTAGQFRESFALAREAGFSNISVDLMSGLPGQSLQTWEQTLQAAAGLRPEHISAYSLILEDGTPFWDMYGDGSIKHPAEGRNYPALPDEDTERRMYEMTEEILSAYGYHRYEISNYALDGYESIHNTGYWTGAEYIGFGLGASSLLGNRRMKNTASLDAYLADPAGSRYTEEELTAEDQMAEFMILGLRMMRGVSGEEFRARFGRQIQEIYGDVIERHLQNGLLERSGERIRLSRKGISLANVVMADFL